MVGSQHLHLYHFPTPTAFCKSVACSLAGDVSTLLTLCVLLGRTCRQPAPCCGRLSLRCAVPRAAHTLPLRWVVMLTCQSRLRLCCCCTAVPVAAHVAQMHRSAALTAWQQVGAQSCQLSLGNEENTHVLDSHLVWSKGHQCYKAV